MRGLQGKGVVITGGSRGIGRATAQRFLEEGARVFIGGLEADEVAETVHTLAVHGPIAGMAGEISDEQQVKRFIAAAEETLGGINILLSNAGIVQKERFLDIRLEDWEHLLAVNLRGMFLTAREGARRMIARGTRGAIVLMASKNGLAGEARLAHYNASKGGVLLLMKTMALELGPYGIRVNALCPGYIETPMNAATDSPQFMADYARQIPLGRIGRPEEVAAAYAFLASEEASFLHGTALVVDGGQLAW